jgi:hypothetical protein
MAPKATPENGRISRAMACTIQNRNYLGVAGFRIAPAMMVLLASGDAP